MLRRAWRAMGGSERDSPQEIKAAITRKPVEVQIRCYNLWMLLLSGCLPSSRVDLWVDFGFASCTSEEEENVLCRQYQRLITMCTFDEFCGAYSNHCIPNLFHSKGLQVNGNAHLWYILSGNSEGQRKFVWVLKKFVVHGPSSGEEFSAIVPAILDYGFINCWNANDWQQLQKVYKSFFTVHHGDPLALYEACIEGNIYGFLSNMMPLPPKHQRLLTRQRYTVVSLHTPSRPWYSTWQVSLFVLLVFGVIVMYWM